MLKSLCRNTILTVAIATVSSGAFAADKVYKLKLAESWGTNFPSIGDSVKNMVKMADEMYNGRLKIKVDSANKHKAPFGVFDMVFLLGALAFHEDHFAQNERQRDTGPVRSKRREILKPPYLARSVLYKGDQVMTYHAWLV